MEDTSTEKEVQCLVKTSMIAYLENYKESSQKKLLYLKSKIFEPHRIQGQYTKISWNSLYQQ